MKGINELAVVVLPTTRSLFEAAIVTLLFAVLARYMRGVTLSGAVAGGIICFLVYAGAGAGAFLALVTVFLLAWSTTRLGYQRKKEFGTAEERDGRKPTQIFANLGVAAVSAVMYMVTQGNEMFLLVLAAALAESAADTVSSEFGQACSDQARLLTTWKPVRAGTNGGVSFAGTLAGFSAAVVVSIVCVFAGLLRWSRLWIAAVAAITGMIADSFLGAWLERRRMLSNDSVNFISTLIAAAMAVLLA